MRNGQGLVSRRLSPWLSPGGLLAISFPLGLLGGVTGYYGLKVLAVLAFVGGSFWLLARGILQARDDPPF